MYAIEIKNLTKVYSSGLKKKFLAIDDLSLNIDEGEIFGFLGPNGAGKSTTIKAILGIIRPTSGEIFISGKKSSDPSSRAKVGFLPENPIFYEYLTAEELLLYVGQTFGMEKKDIVEKGNRLISQMGLEDAKKTRLRYFSKGMIQKIGLIQAVIHDPDILILDEPASGLDPIGRRQMRDLLLSFKGMGKTIFFSSHILHDVE
ncbi:MAG: ABC transporter ATP-binding protein, partial [Nitrospinota bacterium]